MSGLEGATPIVLDVDTGIDDALALLFAARHPGLSMLGVTCVDGNTDVDHVVANTLSVLTIAGAGHVPVARGAERPLLAEPRYAVAAHGMDGLGDIGIRLSRRKPDARHAVEFLRDTITHHHGKVTVVATGPLTNIALLLRTCPQVMAKIERVVVMGGSAGNGNATAVAEFNVWHDPESAAIVLGCGLPVTMYGLDVFSGLCVSAEKATQLAQAEDPAAKLAARLLHAQIALTNRAGEACTEAILGDYGTLATIVDPGGVRLESLPTLVLTGPGPSRGQTIVDRRPFRNLAEGDRALTGGTIVDVALEVDAERYVSLWLKTIGG